MEVLKYVVTGALLASLGFAQQSAPQQNETLKIVVVEGQGGINIAGINSPLPIVEVRDKNDKLVAGAHLTFVLPRTGPRAEFAGGNDSLSETTKTGGRGPIGEMRPIGIGSFEITVRAEYRGEFGVTTISQRNFATTADAQAAENAPVRNAPGAAPQTSLFKIEILEGDDGVNIIETDTAVAPLVRILDKNDLPVAGVPVVVAILLTRGGGTAEFQGGKTTATAITDANGRAQLALLHPKGYGPIQIQLQTTVEGQPVNTIVKQMNFQTERSALDAGKMPGMSKGDVPQDASKALHAKIISGNDGANIVKDKIIAKQIVEVDDNNGAPVAGVKVAFVLPLRGVGAVFDNGKSYMIETTDANGRVSADPMRPTGKGAFNINIVAAYQGVTISEVIQQTNFATVAAAQKAGKTPGASQGGAAGAAAGMSAATKALLVIGVVAGVAGGIAGAAASKNSSSSNTSSSAAASCNASSLQSQLVAAFQNLVNICATTQSNVNAATSTERSIAGQYCSCIGKQLEDVNALVLVELDACLRSYTPAYAATQVCQ